MIAAEDRERRGLGRGLSALFGEEQQAGGQPAVQVTSALPIHLLKPGKFQPRRHFDDAALPRTEATPPTRESSIGRPTTKHALHAFAPARSRVAATNPP